MAYSLAKLETYRSVYKQRNWTKEKKSLDPNMTAKTPNPKNKQKSVPQIKIKLESPIWSLSSFKFFLVVFFFFPTSFLFRQLHHSKIWAKLKNHHHLLMDSKYNLTFIFADPAYNVVSGISHQVSSSMNTMVPFGDRQIWVQILIYHLGEILHIRFSTCKRESSYLPHEILNSKWENT